MKTFSLRFGFDLLLAALLGLVLVACQTRNGALPRNGVEYRMGYDEKGCPTTPDKKQKQKVKRALARLGIGPERHKVEFWKEGHKPDGWLLDPAVIGSMNDLVCTKKASMKDRSATKRTEASGAHVTQRIIFNNSAEKQAFLNLM